MDKHTAMTREEQVKKYAPEVFGVQGNLYTTAFMDGVKFADEHPQSPWIDINVELPEVKKRVIFLCNNGEAYFGYNNIDNKSATITNASDGVKVTHWMPIPELPKNN